MGAMNELKKTIVIGHIALIQRTKKQGFVLDVIIELRKRGIDALGVFAGECREEDYYQLLTSRIEKEQLNNSVVFLGRRNDIPDLLKLLDVLIIPSSFEGFPLVGLEAASARVPVAACNVAGAKEFVEVSGAGAIFNEENTEEAVNAILDIMNNKKRLGEKGIAFAKTCSESNYSRSLHRIIESI